MSIQGGVHFDLLKRVLRDISRSGQNPEEIIDQVSATVFPMFRVRHAVTCLPQASLLPRLPFLVGVFMDTVDWLAACLHHVAGLTRFLFANVDIH